MNKPLPITEYMELAYRRRGELINQTIMIERAMEQYLVQHFCTESDRQIELLETLLSTTHVSFFAKLEVVIIILERHDPTFLYAYPDVKKELTDIMEQRNIIAHSVLDFSNIMRNNANSKIVVTKYRGKKPKPIEYDEKRFNNLIILINKYGAAFYHWKRVLFP